jgi:hypothetical protein
VLLLATPSTCRCVDLARLSSSPSVLFPWPQPHGSLCDLLLQQCFRQTITTKQLCMTCCHNVIAHETASPITPYLFSTWTSNTTLLKPITDIQIGKLCHAPHAVQGRQNNNFNVDGSNLNPGGADLYARIVRFGPFEKRTSSCRLGSCTLHALAHCAILFPRFLSPAIPAPFASRRREDLVGLNSV